MLWTHMILSGMAFVATPLLFRRGFPILVAWVGIAVLAAVMFLMTLDQIMAKTGMYF